MKKVIAVVLVNIVLFYLIRILSVFVAFGFGIGASASSSKYEIILPLIDVLTQLAIMLIFVLKRKWGLNIIHFGIALSVIISLGLLAFFEIIP